MSTVTTLSQINKEVFNILYRELGISKTLRFLSQFSNGTGDYTEWKEEIYKGKTVSELVEEMKKQRQQKTV